jgi:hypothetical protein
MTTSIRKSLDNRCCVEHKYVYPERMVSPLFEPERMLARTPTVACLLKKKKADIAEGILRR